MGIDRRLVMQYDEGQTTFRHIDAAAGYTQLFRLAEAINRFQEDDVRRVLLVTVADLV